ncbi:YraN family protein [Cellulophaga sp. HaHaR_3_176]|uniref:YraN family protein n=1 Tax=Cellulophaga sp. HaHaR_3_176 TaxID=1942464 RepID=UPI001C1F5352|nr:YraN family protein [Cellulophaga sp. HaHaR_3_176]QWX83929.1 YraN family protein [Cellulophaga sp. HaHaR_3_176]
MADHNEFGKIGEQLAVDFLIKKGFKIKHRNYRYLKAEIDVIAQVSNQLVVVEVKARASGFIGDLKDMIPKKKRDLLVLAANNYVIEKNIDLEIRFDVITIVKENGTYTIDHIEDAFYFF